MKKKPSQRSQRPAASARNAKPRIRLDRERVGKYLGILFHLNFVERQMGVAGLSVPCGWLPDWPVIKLIEEQVLGPGEDTFEREEVGDLISSCWDVYRETFGTLEEFDPERFLDWLEAGDFERVPFRGKPKGLWALPYEIPVG